MFSLVVEYVELDDRIYDLKRKRILPRNVNQKDICLNIHNIINVLIGRKLKKTVY